MQIQNASNSLLKRFSQWWKNYRKSLIYCKIYDIDNFLPIFMEVNLNLREQSYASKAQLGEVSLGYVIFH